MPPSRSAESSPSGDTPSDVATLHAMLEEEKKKFEAVRDVMQAIK